jgi:N-acetylneuraminic acid mutarotase
MTLLFKAQDGIRQAHCIQSRKSFFLIKYITLLFITLAFWMGQSQLSITHAAGWTSGGNLATVRYGHTTTIMPNGRTLVIGGVGSGNNFLSSTELYDPINNTWSPAASMAIARYYHTATLLPDNRVLVVGGAGVLNSGSFSSAEIYDPVKNTWSLTSLANIREFRERHTATLLLNGSVLIVGGRYNLGDSLLYSPMSNTWSSGGKMSTGRHDHTSTLLSNGRVLVVGGTDINNRGYSHSSVEIYDPSSNTWFSAANLATSARELHTSTLMPNGQVLVVGGLSYSSSATVALATAELYDPANNTWRSVANLPQPRRYHTATLMPNGRVLIAGGHNNGISFSSTVLYDLASNTWSFDASMTGQRQDHTATLMPNGRLLVVGGISSLSYVVRNEIYDWANNAWSSAGNLSEERAYHTTTLLPNGHVVAVGGVKYSSTTSSHIPISSAEIYNPVSNTWKTVASLKTARQNHTATLLHDGRMLVVGGSGNSGTTLSGTEIYDLTSNTWGVTSNELFTRRQNHTATLLPNGRLLVVGGSDGQASLASVELYDPSTNSWSKVASLTTARSRHTASLLPNGRVLVVGGGTIVSNGLAVALLSSAELYDPVSNTWSNVASLTAARHKHTAAVQPNGRLLVLGGIGNNGIAASSELYDFADNAWYPATSLLISRYESTILHLPNGRALVMGGNGLNSDTLSSVEFYDAVKNRVTIAASLTAPRYAFSATLLHNGRVLLVGGFGEGSAGALISSTTVTPQSNPILTVSTSPAKPTVGQTVTITANIVSNNASGQVTFTANGQVLPGCSSVGLATLPIAPNSVANVESPLAPEARVSICTLPNVAPGQLTVSVSFRGNFNESTAQTSLVLNPITSQAAPQIDYTDMWWAGRTENGWGLSITQHGAIQFNAFYIYDTTGKPVWIVMPGGQWNTSAIGLNAPYTLYTGALYQPTGSAFANYDATQFRPGSSVGSATLSFANANSGTFTYTVNGVSGTKQITRQPLVNPANPDISPRIIVNDLWWAGSSENGWGINIAQQDRQLFMVWYTYSADGKTTWFTVPSGAWNGMIFAGDLYATTGSPWLGTVYDPSKLTVTKVGAISINFKDTNNALMSYTVNGITQTKAIVRQTF